MWSSIKTTPAAPPTIESSEFHESIPRVPPHSCFVAGTQVWTLTGAVPIEAVHVGDCVLSQNTESGELTFKPVLRKAIRQSSQVFKIESSGEASGQPAVICFGWQAKVGPKRET